MTTYEATPAQLREIQSDYPETTPDEMSEAVAFGGDELRADIADHYQKTRDQLAGCDLCVEVDTGFDCYHHYFKGDELVCSLSV